MNVSSNVFKQSRVSEYNWLLKVKKVDVNDLPKYKTVEIDSQGSIQNKAFEGNGLPEVKVVGVNSLCKHSKLKIDSRSCNQNKLSEVNGLSEVRIRNVNSLCVQQNVESGHTLSKMDDRSFEPYIVRVHDVIHLSEQKVVRITRSSKSKKVVDENVSPEINVIHKTNQEKLETKSRSFKKREFDEANGSSKIKTVCFNVLTDQEKGDKVNGSFNRKNANKASISPKLKKVDINGSSEENKSLKLPIVCLHKRVSKMRNLSKVKLNIKLHYCDKCNKSFSRKVQLNVHKREHVDRILPDKHKPFLCSECPASFKCNSGLLAHEIIHLGTKPFRCNLCKGSFTQKSHLKRHLSVHSNSKRFKCPVCKKRFRLNSYLISHDRVHTGEKPHTCDECNKSFSQKSHLNTHKKSHSKIKEFSCDECNKQFTLIAHLKYHIEHVHPIDDVDMKLFSSKL